MPDNQSVGVENASNIEYCVVLPDASEVESEEDDISLHYASGRPSWRLQNPARQLRIHTICNPTDIPRTLRLRTAQLIEVPSAAQDVVLPPRHLDTARTRVHVVISIKSGKEHAESVFQNALEPLLDALGLKVSSSYTIHRTTSSSSISELTTSTILPAAVAGVAQTILLLSGDGGILDILHTLLSSLPAPRPPSYVKPILGLLPLGTGNALANSSGILSDSTLGLSTLLRGTPSPLPSFTVRFDPPARSVNAGGAAVELVHGAVVFSWGLHASLVADSDTPEYRKHGSDRFQQAAKENLFPSDGSAPHAYRGDLTYVTGRGRSRPSQTVRVGRREHAYVLVTLCAQLEKGFLISPDSGPLDGRLRLVHFGPAADGGKGVMDIMTEAFSGGKHVGREEVGYEEIEELRLEVQEGGTGDGGDGGDNGDGDGGDRWRRVCVDGMIFVVPRGGQVVVAAAAATSRRGQSGGGADGDGDNDDVKEDGVLDLLHLPQKNRI